MKPARFNLGEHRYLEGKAVFSFFSPLEWISLVLSRWNSFETPFWPSESVGSPVFSLFFYKGFRHRVVFTYIYTFSPDILLIEITKQHVTWSTEAIWNSSALYFCGFAAFCWLCCLLEQLQGTYRGSHILGIFSADKNVPLSPEYRFSVK